MRLSSVNLKTSAVCFSRISIYYAFTHGGKAARLKWTDPLTDRNPCFWLDTEARSLMALSYCCEIISRNRDAPTLEVFLSETINGLYAYLDPNKHMFYQPNLRKCKPGYGARQPHQPRWRYHILSQRAAGSG